MKLPEEIDRRLRAHHLDVGLYAFLSTCLVGYLIYLWLR